MAALGRFIMDTAKVALDALNPAPIATNDRGPPPKFESPSPKVVLEVKDLLFKTFKLPLEIVDVIIDYAEYWPRTTVTTSGRTFRVGGSESDKLILRTFPLGHLPEIRDNGLPIIPEDSYFLKTNIAHDIESSDTIQSMTSTIFTVWKAHSLPRTENPFRKVVFTIKSKDQGWGSERRPHHGLYEHSWSWFDVGLERLEAINMDACISENHVPEGFIEQFRLESRDDTLQVPTSVCCDFRSVQPPVINDPANPSSYKYDHPSEPTGNRLQSNRTANREVKEHVIIWASDDCIEPLSSAGDRLEAEGRGRLTGDGKFVRGLKVGDIITVWARARFPGWQNLVEEVKIDVFWVV